MKFGNYNLTTAESKKHSRGKIIILRFTKVKSTATYLFEKFNNKLDALCRINGRSESPLSYETSLFDENGRSIYQRPDRFSPKDFPRRIFSQDNYYAFGGNVKYNQKSISGKNENYYTSICESLKTLRKREKKKIDSVAAKKQRFNINLRQLLEANIADETVEYKILKDYFETNSYSDIVNDHDFKNYLSKKNYKDILDYIDNEDDLATTVRGSATMPRNYKSSGQKSPHSTKTPSSFCNSMKRVKKIFNKNDREPLPSHEIKKTVYKVHDKNCTYAKSYCELISYCEAFLNEICNAESFDLNFSETKYVKSIDQFTKSKGFKSTEEYIELKFGKILNRLLKNQTKSNGGGDRQSDKKHIENNHDDDDDSFQQQYTESINGNNNKDNRMNDTSKITNFLLKDAFKNFDYVNHKLRDRETLSTDKINLKNYNNFYFNKRYIDDVSESFYKDNYKLILTDSDYISDSSKTVDDDDEIDGLYGGGAIRKHNKDGDDDDDNSVLVMGPGEESESDLFVCDKTKCFQAVYENNWDTLTRNYAKSRQKCAKGSSLMDSLYSSDFECVWS